MAQPVSIPLEAHHHFNHGQLLAKHDNAVHGNDVPPRRVFGGSLHRRIIVTATHVIDDNARGSIIVSFARFVGEWRRRRLVVVVGGGGLAPASISGGGNDRVESCGAIGGDSGNDQ